MRKPNNRVSVHPRSQFRTLPKLPFLLFCNAHAKIVLSFFWVQPFFNDLSHASNITHISPTASSALCSSNLATVPLDVGRIPHESMSGSRGKGAWAGCPDAPAGFLGATLQVPDLRFLQITDSKITGSRVQTRGYRLQSTDCGLEVRGHRLHIAGTGCCCWCCCRCCRLCLHPCSFSAACSPSCWGLVLRYFSFSDDIWYVTRAKIGTRLFYIF